ncbi:MAG TPA: serine/threonine-protein kinase [Phycisphaerae bacterium]|nr:serine/threonine-protein kinase [Phycisphaerae bacterium]
MAVEEDSHLGRRLVEHKLATANEVALCVARQKELEEQGQKISLADVLVEAGYLTKSQLVRLRRSMDDDSMYRPAQQIPGFQILGKLGQGAMATVFKAKQISLDRPVAIKVLPKRLSDNQEFVDRFYREGRAAARLNHPNIVQAIDVGEAGGYHYFVMEYIDGNTVFDQVSSGEPYAELDALRIILQVAYALEHAHARGFIHRDVKPKNIMITKESDVKLADMGLARDIRDYETASAEAGRAYGTPYYISPEQIRGEINIDFRADIYSLGATFYHMVTGKVPFEGATPSAVMHKHLKEVLIPPDHVNTQLSAGIGEIIELMMAKKRDDRYPSTKELIADLEAVAAGEPPYQARKKYDHALLHDLATSGETVSMATAEDLDPTVGDPGRSLIIMLLSIALALSILLNIAILIFGFGGE